MGIDYSAASGVGVRYEDIQYKHLIEKSKSVLREDFVNSDYDYVKDIMNELCPDGEWVGDPKVILEEHLEDFWDKLHCYEKREFLDSLGLTEVSNWGFDSDIDMIGTPLYAKISTYKEDLEKAIKDFREVLNVEPEIFNGFFIY